MKKLYKNVGVIVLSLIVVCVLAVTAFAATTDVSTNPLDTGKEILYYLFWTNDTKLNADVENLQEELSLTDAQIEQLKNLGLNEHIGIQTLSESFSSNARASVAAFNYSLDEYTEDRNNTIQDILGDKTDNFRDWIAEWWEYEREYRMRPQIATISDVERLSNVWATQYVPNTTGAIEVALPDKYVKFANLGWDDTYDDPPYTVNVFNPENEKTLLSVSVDDVGPWNENDNYWDEDRRKFSDLDVGVPEAYAAFYDDYNNGKDEFDRKVTNPAGIDLSTAAAKALGFGTYESGFVDVRYEYLP